MCSSQPKREEIMAISNLSDIKDSSFTGDLYVSGEVVLIYTWLVYGVLCQVLNIFGIITNIINIICFAKQDFKDSVNISLLGLSVSDLGSLITMMWTSFSLAFADVAGNLPFDPVEVSYLISAMPHFSFTRVSSCITAMITLERCMCIVTPLQVKRIITPKRVTVTTICAFIIFFCSGFPVYAVNKLDFKFSTVRNKSIVGIIFMEGRENVEQYSFIINNFSIPICAFMIIVISTGILSLKLRKTTNWRVLATHQGKKDRVSSRNQKTAKMVLMISTLFILCFIPSCIVMIAVAFVPSISVQGKYLYIGIMIGGFGFIMESINSSMNIFIYYHMSSKYRGCFRNIFWMRH